MRFLSIEVVGTQRWAVARWGDEVATAPPWTWVVDGTRGATLEVEGDRGGKWWWWRQEHEKARKTTMDLGHVFGLMRPALDRSLLIVQQLLNDLKNNSNLKTVSEIKHASIVSWVCIWRTREGDQKGVNGSQSKFLAGTRPISWN
jgi:hypothetical protein